MELIDAKTAAQRLGVSKRRVLALIRDGRIDAQRVGGAFVFDASELEKVRVRRPGRPRKRSDD